MNPEDYTAKLDNKENRTRRIEEIAKVFGCHPMLLDETEWPELSRSKPRGENPVQNAIENLWVFQKVPFLSAEMNGAMSELIVELEGNPLAAEKSFEDFSRIVKRLEEIYKM